MHMTRLRLRNPALLLLQCLLLGGCSDPAPPLPVLAPDAVILAFGDSLTAGTGAGRDQAFPAQLERLTGRTVINAGVAGEFSAQGLQRLPALLDRHQPQLLILCHAGNDILRNRDRDQAATNLHTMVEQALDRDIAVLLLGVPEPGLRLRAAAFYRDVARASGVPLLNDLVADILSSNRYKSDAVHPNAAGYEAMAERIYAELQRAGAL
jgi:acyl-CoA thioesterase I